MPYATIADLPRAVRDHLPAAAQRIFRRVVNAELDRGLSERRAFAAAWTAVRRGWEKNAEGTWVEKGWRTQPRVPAGSPKGGQWGSAEGGFVPLSGVAGLTREQRLADAGFPASSYEVASVDSKLSINEVKPIDPISAPPAHEGEFTEFTGKVADELNFHINFKSQLDELSEDERKAITVYSGSGFYQINKFEKIHRGKTEGINPHTVETYTNISRNIDSALAKSSMTKNVVVYRGIKQSTFDRIRDSLIPGESAIMDLGFTSTTTRKNIALNYTEGSSHVVVRLRVKKGQRALSTYGLSKQANELEVLLPRGSRVMIRKISDVVEDLRDITYVDADLLD